MAFAKSTFCIISLCFCCNAMMVLKPTKRIFQSTLATASKVNRMMQMSSVAYDGKEISTVAKLDPSKTALLLIEYQNEFTTPGGKLHDAVKPCMDQSSMLKNSIELVKVARQKGVKLFHAAISFTENYREIVSPYGILGNVKGGSCFVKSTWGSDFIESMKPSSEDIIVDGKRGLCTFGSTNLDFLLRHNGVENLVLAGFLTNCCVESTMRTGYEKGYKVITLTDCTASTSIEAHAAAVQFTFPMFSLPMTHSQFIDMLP